VRIKKESKIIKTKSDIKREKYEQLQKVLKEQTEAKSLLNNEEEAEKDEVYYSKHFIIILFFKLIFMVNFIPYLY
jgi:hypothetical protein